MNQQTLKTSVTCSGVGVHTGAKAQLRIYPASIDHGIVFRRVDQDEGCTRDIRACARKVSGLRLGTTVSNDHGDCVATIEHLMAACLGMGLDNLLIEIDGPEVPIMDGSSAVFCNLFDAAGIVPQAAARRVIRILRDVEVRDGDKWARLSPASGNALSLHARIEFDSAAIGTQEARLRLMPGEFDKHIAFARTFGFAHEVTALQAMGFARGGSLDNAIVIHEEKVVNPEGLRSEDEFVRHKLLDAVGDLALAGGTIAGHYEADRPGHALNNALILKLLDETDAWCWETQTPIMGGEAARVHVQTMSASTG